MLRGPGRASDERQTVQAPLSRNPTSKKDRWHIIELIVISIHMIQEWIADHLRKKNYFISLMFEIEKYSCLVVVVATMKSKAKKKQFVADVQMLVSGIRTDGRVGGE